MNLKRLGFWSVLFCGLLVYVLLFEQSKDNTQQPPTLQPERIFTFERDAITAIRVASPVKEIMLNRDGNSWKSDKGGAAPIGKEHMDSLITAMADAVNIKIVSEDPQNLKQFGLHEPEYEVNVWQTGSTAPQSLLLGNTAPTGTSLYVKLKSDNRIILSGTYLRFSLKTFLDRM
ncbi:MAG: DUF4340 domain-containing protein [bacterium]|nr:DUF4340 domain-containing protein [bacterium]